MGVVGALSFSCHGDAPSSLLRLLRSRQESRNFRFSTRTLHGQEFSCWQRSTSLGKTSAQVEGVSRSSTLVEGTAIAAPFTPCPPFDQLFPTFQPPTPCSSTSTKKGMRFYPTQKKTSDLPELHREGSVLEGLVRVGRGVLVVLVELQQRKASGLSVSEM